MSRIEAVQAVAAAGRAALSPMREKRISVKTPKGGTVRRSSNFTLPFFAAQSEIREKGNSGDQPSLRACCENQRSKLARSPR